MESGLANAKKTMPVTFRLPVDVVEQLKGEADGDDVSFGTLGREVLTRYVRWDSKGRKLYFVPATRRFLRELLEKIPDEAVEELAGRSGKEDIINMMFLSGLPLRLDSFIEVFNLWLKETWMSVTMERGSGYRYFISHDIGRKWSIYVAAMAKAVSLELDRPVAFASETGENRLFLSFVP
jgi:hypothetical protein